LLHHLVIGLAKSAGGIVGRHDDDDAFIAKHSELAKEFSACKQAQKTSANQSANAATSLRCMAPRMYLAQYPLFKDS
jgi:hypothetical protein